MGFTLVEIAIVLVIIGLLLGGVLKGQELVNSAKVKNLANGSRQTDDHSCLLVDHGKEIGQFNRRTAPADSNDSRDLNSSHVKHLSDVCWLGKSGSHGAGRACPDEVEGHFAKPDLLNLEVY